MSEQGIILGSTCCWNLLASSKLSVHRKHSKCLPSRYSCLWHPHPPCVVWMFVPPNSHDEIPIPAGWCWFLCFWWVGHRRSPCEWNQCSYKGLGAKGLIHSPGSSLSPMRAPWSWVPSLRNCEAIDEQSRLQHFVLAAPTDWRLFCAQETFQLEKSYHPSRTDHNSYHPPESHFITRSQRKYLWLHMLFLQ